MNGPTEILNVCELLTPVNHPSWPVGHVGGLTAVVGPDRHHRRRRRSPTGVHNAATDPYPPGPRGAPLERGGLTPPVHPCSSRSLAVACRPTFCHRLRPPYAGSPRGVRSKMGGDRCRMGGHRWRGRYEPRPSRVQRCSVATPLVETLVAKVLTGMVWCVQEERRSS